VTRLVFADMLGSARIWLGSFIVVAIAAFTAAVPAALVETGLRDGTLAGLALVAIAGTITVLSGVATVVVVGTVMRLTVALRRRSYALWQTVGVSPARVRGVVVTQLLVVAVAGSALGAAVGALVVPAAAESALQGANGVDAIVIGISPAGAAVAAAVVVVVALLAGDGAARRAARTSPLEVLRATPAARRARTWPRWVLAGLLLAVVVQMLAGLAASAAAGSGAAAILIGPLLVAVVAVLGPAVFPRVMRQWTALVPAGASASWFVARANTLYAVDRSSTVVASLLVAVAVPGSFAAGQGTLADALGIIAGTGGPSADTSGTTLLVLGGPVLLAAAGAAAATVMSSGARAREGALLSAAGAPPGFGLATALWEAVIQVGTAALLAAAVVAVTAGAESLVLATVAPGTTPDFAPATVATVFGLSAVGILLATLVPTLATRNQVIPSALSGE
jgi:putative ABC transport system permease protein